MLTAVAWFLFACALATAGWLWRERRRLQRRLDDAELRRLRTQLNPHFLYNTLNAVSELGYNDPKTADEVVTQLSLLLRKCLDDVHQNEIALRDEVVFLERYLGIQKILLRDRLQYALAFDEGTLNARVPGMIVQPLAENALTHGAGVDGGVELRVASVRDGDSLVVTVEDRGPGLRGEESGPGRGIGLANIHARLRRLYGDAARLTLQPRPGGGLMAQLVVPYHEGFAYREAARPDRR